MRLKSFFVAMVAAVMLLGSSIYSQAAAIWYPLPQEAYSFEKNFPDAQYLLFAFDYGHALLYEKLIAAQGIGKPLSNNQSARKTSGIDFGKMEEETLKQVFEILHNPPHKKTDEEDIAPQYVYYFPWVSSLFDWSHYLHQFVFDVYQTYPGQTQKIDQRVKELMTTYKSRPKIAIPTVCKTMDLMDGHYYSKIFRKEMPKYNQLIWSYHWFQIKLYDDLLLPTLTEQKAAAAKTMEKFWQLISDLPNSSGFTMMPMSAEVAPKFYAKSPDIAWSFDSNHMLHDVINDILVSPLVKDRPQEGLKAAQIVLDPKTFACNSGGNPGNIVVTITGNADGACSPVMVDLTKGKAVDLTLKGDSTMFRFEAADFGLDLMSMPGQPVLKTFTPNTAGTFPFTCGPHGAPPKTHGTIMVM